MPSKRVLAVVTSRPTGFWLAELAHPYHFLLRAGHRVEVASPAGGETAYSPYSDPHGDAEHGDLLSLGFLHWPDAQRAYRETTALAAVDPAAYDAVYFAGGTGPLEDFPDNKDIAVLVEALWAAGGTVAAVCHGVIALTNPRNPDGTPWLTGRTVTGFSKAEDRALESFAGPLPRYVEDDLRAAGADYRDGGPGASFTVADPSGRLVTGQNQQSATAFGQRLAEALG